MWLCVAPSARQFYIRPLTTGLSKTSISRLRYVDLKVPPSMHLGEAGYDRLSDLPIIGISDRPIIGRYDIGHRPLISVYRSISRLSQYLPIIAYIGRYSHYRYVICKIYWRLFTLHLVHFGRYKLISADKVFIGR